MKVVRALAFATPFLLASGTTVALAMLTACNRAEQAPAVAYTLLDGRKSDLAALRGHVVLVNFWATDCAPCVAEMPLLAETWRKFSPSGFDTLAVSMAYDPPFAVSNFAQSRHLPFGVAIDNTGEIEARFGGVRYTPTSILIDRRGRIVARWIGATDIPELEKQIARLLQHT
jgi:peroxiredoxin